MYTHDSSSFLADSGVKMSMPERLTPYLKSSRKTNGWFICIYTYFHVSLAHILYILYSYKFSISLHVKIVAGVTGHTLSCGQKTVRRNLNFTKTQVTVTKSFRRTNTYDIVKKLEGKYERSRVTRKSSLLPPNTIKDLHIKDALKNTMLDSHSHSTIQANSGKKCFNPVKKSENDDLALLQKSEGHTASITHRKNNKTSVIQHTSSRALEMNDQSGINILPSPSLDRTDSSNDVKKEIANDLKHDENHDTTNDSEYSKLYALSVDFVSELKLLVSRFEENLSTLKLPTTAIRNTSSAANLISKITEIHESKLKQQTEYLNNNAEAANSANLITDDMKKACKSSRRMASANDKENNETLNLSKQSGFNSSTRRRSARLMAKSLNSLDITNDSFINLENQLLNATSDTIAALPGNCTPAKDTLKDKRVGRPLKEYMALKSRMSCLLTPNIKLNSVSKKNAHPKSAGARASLSNTILVELTNLYTDSPDVQ